MASDRSLSIIKEMVQFSVDIIKSCEKLRLHPSISNQIIKSSSSIGANFSEAQEASSKKDFINKIYIAKKEATETRYWLAIISTLEKRPPDIESLRQKAQQFTMLLQKIINSSRKSAKNR